MVKQVATKAFQSVQPMLGAELVASFTRLFNTGFSAEEENEQV